jgi:hypothetical protein
MTTPDPSVPATPTDPTRRAEDAEPVDARSEDARAADALVAEAIVSGEEPAGRRWSSPRTAVTLLWRSSQRWLVILAGFALLAGGVALLVLPGPGLVVIIAGLALLAREFVWAEKALAKAKEKAAAGAGTMRKVARRR